MNMLTNNQKVLIAALVGFIIGAGAIWVWTVSNSATREVPEEESQTDVSEEVKTEEKSPVTTPETTPAQTGGSAPQTLDNSELIKVMGQKAGTEVMVNVTLDAAGWVAIHEDREGSLGNVLGARWVAAGTQDATVMLLRATTAGKTYHAVLYNDDGDRQFEYGIDARLLDGSKQPVQAQFTAQ